MTKCAAKSVSLPNERQAIRSCLGMGTVITHQVHGMLAEQALLAAERETTRLEKLLSRFLPDSDIGRVNASAGIRNVEVGREAMEVLTKAAEFAKCSGGCFDVTIGPLVELWSTGKKALRPPHESQIQKALSLVGFDSLRLDSNSGTAGLLKKGQTVDLGGIAKGFAADRVLSILRQYGVQSAYTDFGGNVATLGAKPDGSPWRVGIRHPRGEGLIGALSIIGQSVVTSGDDQRFFMGRDKKRYHHMLDPKTGYPAESNLLSVTVVSDCSLDADALSTVLFVAGLEKGLAILRSFAGIEAVFVDSSEEVFITKGLLGSFQPGERANIQIVS